MKRIAAAMIDRAPVWIWRPGNLRFVGRHTVHFCVGGDGQRTVEIDAREVLRGRRTRNVPRSWSGG
jgi:hypothetical protein